MIRDFVISLRSITLLWVLTALIYPAVILLVGQVAFPYQANGSLITDASGQVVGSALIGQSFTSPQYFQSRPSTTNYSEGDDAALTGVSGASNLSPDNPDLLARIQADADRLHSDGIHPTADLLYTSGSSLDPHISPAAAQTQIARVAEARALSPEQIQSLITQNTDGRFLGLFGEPGVNVLGLNLALDHL